MSESRTSETAYVSVVLCCARQRARGEGSRVLRGALARSGLSDIQKVRKEEPVHASSDLAWHLACTFRSHSTVLIADD